MRILNIRFKNLNSLTGEWEIDLTHPSFSCDGIFAITGPTGAGKTTVLDAICLALYGRTPRLEKITKNDNQLMSRQSGECFAEVTFETQAGSYRCHWSQHRARKKADGELQAPKHEISDAKSGKVLESKIRGVAGQIEAVTGIDFERFTRSMLLAQGGFAAFLQADPDKRAPILEQITGTEIYSRISIGVHEWRLNENKKLQILQSEISVMQLLNPEDEERYKSDLQSSQLKETELSQKITSLRQTISVLDRIIQFQKELNLLEERKQDLNVRLEAFQPDFKRLENANRALELSADYARLCSLRYEQENDLQRIQKLLSDVPNQETMVNQSESTMSILSADLEKKRTVQKETVQIIRKVRELDLLVQEKDAPIRNAIRNIAELQKSFFNLRSQNDQDNRILCKKKKLLEEISQSIQQTISHQTLIENLEAIKRSFDSLRDLDQRQKEKSEEVKLIEVQKNEASRLWNEKQSTLIQNKKHLQSIQDMLLEKGNELADILENRQITDWRNELSSLKDKKNVLEKAVETFTDLNEAEKTFAELDKSRNVLLTEKDNLTQQLTCERLENEKIERELHLLETQLSLLKRIQDLEQFRCQLQDEEPCPLCGAKDHPFAKGNIPLPDETRTKLNIVRNDYKISNNNVSSLMIKLTGNKKDIELTENKSRELVERIKSEKSRIEELLISLIVDYTCDITELLGQLSTDIENGYNRVLKIVKKAEDLEKTIAILRESVEKTKETVTELDLEAQSVFHRESSYRQAFEMAAKESEILSVKFGTAIEMSLKQVEVYGIENLSIRDLDDIQSKLTALRDQWVNCKSKKDELEKETSLLEEKLKHQKEKIGISEVDIKKQQEILDGLKTDLDVIKKERMQLFGNKITDFEEQSLSAMVELAEKSLDNARQKFNYDYNELGRLKSRIESIEKTAESRIIQIKTCENAFLARLERYGFSDEADFKDACISQDDRGKLIQKAQLLQNEKTELVSKLQDKKLLLEKERQKQTSTQSYESLSEELNNVESGLKTVQQEIGAICQKLNDDFDIRKKFQERINAIELQKRECSRWDLLHELIGSADGKKYRNFAQSLTFELMIRNANIQLNKLTERYLLVKDESVPLELNVVDNYQAGEIRSTKNLSGGESFIVSLSLALGLSHMASKNVRVDSLFLDEGFGTLDDDALDSALETLAGLHKSGKMIGVISHVKALKERIGTQIQIIPLTGGKSAIMGPGCRSIKSNSIKGSEIKEQELEMNF